ncbi:aconitase family protein, partial [Staphylococcus auricularis]|uniref:aconitase family protein n=1 Tax=Staphylococcus auricularis TaxID=29379 RepID=UPI00384EA30A
MTPPPANQPHPFHQTQFHKKPHIPFKHPTSTTIKTPHIPIAPITSSTNTSNPYLILGPTLVAPNPLQKPFKLPSYLKTSLPPPSKLLTPYLTHSPLQPYLHQLAFNLLAYPSTTSIGNS